VGTHVVDRRDDWHALCVASKLGQFVPAERERGRVSAVRRANPERF
jgi:hypothetical protein